MLTKHPALAHDRSLTKILFGSMWLALDDLNRKDIEITDAYANAFTADGEKIAGKFGLRKRVQSAQGGHIYSGVPDPRQLIILKRLAQSRIAV